mmetsp:Transcript_436/g.1501  ORF Transcript_436/g.1501 Transcript_436/m.1501 type:complete len:201 (-) Transcript_436:167-769(-)
MPARGVPQGGGVPSVARGGQRVGERGGRQDPLRRRRCEHVTNPKNRAELRVRFVKRTMRGTATPAATDPARGRGVRSAGTASAPAPAAETGAIGGVGASGAVASRSGKGNERVCLVQKAERLRLDEARRARCGQQVHLRRAHGRHDDGGGGEGAELVPERGQVGVAVKQQLEPVLSRVPLRHAEHGLVARRPATIPGPGT